MPTSYGGGGGGLTGAPHACCCEASIISAAKYNRPLGDRIRIRARRCTGGAGRPQPETGSIPPRLRMLADPAQQHPDG